MDLLSEGLALVFGMAVVLIIFGDALPIRWVGNLDTVFGQKYWHLMDVIYPLASTIVFLGYGQSKGGIQLRAKSILLFVIFLASLVLIQLDDIFVVFQHPVTLPDTYWTTVRWLYLIVATGSFFTFGIECKNHRAKRSVKKF